MNESEFVVGAGYAAPVDMRAEISGTQNPTDWFVESLGGQVSDSGQQVNGYTALTVGPVFQAISIISGTVMTLPVDVIQTLSTKPMRTRKRPDMIASVLLNDNPHPEFLPSTFKELLTAWSVLHGNGIARIDRLENGDPYQLSPLLPNSTYLDRDKEGQLWYMHYPDRGGYEYPSSNTPSHVVPLMPRDVFHIVGPHGGLWGTSLIDVAKNSIGEALALKEFGSSVFKNAARPSGVLEKDAKMEPEQRRNLRREWNAQHAGSANAGNVAILAGGVHWKPTAISNEDAQYMDARRFSRDEMASWTNVPIHMLGGLENSSVRANLEEQNKSFYFHTIRPRTCKWQDESKKKLFTDRQKVRGVFSVRFNPKPLLSVDQETQDKGYAIGRQWGWYSANDVLLDKGQDDIGEQGDRYLVPTNMADAETGEPFGTGNEGIPQEPIEPMAALKPGLIAELSRVMRVEAKSVQRAAKRAGSDPKYNFLTFLDEYYETKLPDIWEEGLRAMSVSGAAMGVVLETSTAAHQYAAETKEFWLDVAQTSHADTLYADVTERIGKWSDRAHLGADMILEAQNE